MKELCYQNRRFLLGYLLLLIAAFCIQLAYGQDGISIALNRAYSPLLDWVCRFGTNIGDGWSFIAVCVGTWFVNKRIAYAMLAIYLLSAGITQGLKHLVFENHLRPSLVLDMKNVHIVEGIELHEHNSFPSGHSTSAFALFAGIAFLYPNKRYQYLLLLPALFAAFTRIYLLQHFFQDTLAGSIIGVASALLVTYLYRTKFDPWKKQEPTSTL